MAATLEQVVKQLTDSGIIAPGKLEPFIPPKADPKTVEELVQALVKSENLTKFQAQHVAAGKTKSLILGEYTILDKIGAGGMGQVFKAQHRRMKRLVAIKMLPPATTKDAAAVARFEREVEAAAKLSHPNIVAAHDAGQANGAHFLVMEYVEGKDLSAMVKKDGPFSVAKSVNYVLQTAKGLEFAHKKGVVHRDIKPANLLLDNEGTVKILDMGLARIESSVGAPAQAELTGTGAIMGTVDYMAPEQGLSTKHADARADIYSLGCTLHYLLVGKAAYDGETVAAKLLAHHTHAIPDLRQLRDEVPEQVETVFKKMVAKKIDDRYQTMTEVVAELERCQAAMNAAASGSTSVWQAPPADQESDLSIAFAHAREHLIPRMDTEEFKPKTKPLHKARPKLSSLGLSSGRKRPILIGLVAAGVLGAGILAAVTVIKMRTQEGTLIVEVNQPDAVIQVLSEEGKVEISQPGGLKPISISVVPGKHRIRVEKDGYVTIADDIEVFSGTMLDIKARLVPMAKPGGLAGESSVSPAPLVSPFDAKQAHAGQAAWAKQLGTTVEQKNRVGMTMVLIPPGEFLMGSTPEQVAWGRKSGEDDKMPPTDGYFSRLPEEMPQHKVTISQPFLMGSTEVTVTQFRKFVEASKYVTEAEKYGSGNSGERALNDKVKEADKGRNWKNPGYPITDDTAVTQITWNDACAYCAWLSEQEQQRPWYRPDGKGGWLIAAHADGYRLPTEAEWEYACRAGTTTQFSFGDDKTQLERYGWFNKNAGGRAQPVALKLPNPFGLFDIHGNAYEWCQDWYDGKWYEKSSPNDPNGPSSGSYRVIRGGYWYYDASYCRSAYRAYITPSYRYYYSGFRCVRVW